MAAPPARARADYDYLIKLLLIGDSGKSLLIISSIIPAGYETQNIANKNGMIFVSNCLIWILMQVYLIFEFESFHDLAFASI